MTIDASAQSVCIVRKGHLGDVLLTEPIAAALRLRHQRVVLCTECEHVGRLLDVYDEVLPYRRFVDGTLNEFGSVVLLAYELYAGIHHLDGYAKGAGIDLPYRVPRLRRGFPRAFPYPYGLIAPSTSPWVRHMRQWPRDRFEALRVRLERVLGFPFIIAEDSVPFDDLIGLIEHTACFIGNDSAPAIMAQCYGRRAFVLFGSTLPELVLLSTDAVGISHNVGCNGCRHFTRHTLIECNSPVCISDLDIDHVVRCVQRGWSVGGAQDVHGHHQLL